MSAMQALLAGASLILGINIIAFGGMAVAQWVMDRKFDREVQKMRARYRHPAGKSVRH